MANCNNDDLLCGSDLCDRSCEDGGFTLFGTRNLLPPFPPIPPIPPIPPGPPGPPMPPPPPPPPAVPNFSFYSVRNATVVSGDNLPLNFISGNPLSVSDSTITLPRGNVLVTYSFQCETVNNVICVETVPYIYGNPQTFGAFRAVRTAPGLHSQSSGDFVVTSDGNTTLQIRAVTETGVTISAIAFDLLIIRYF